MKLSPPIKKARDFFAMKNSDMFAYSPNMADDVSYGDRFFCDSVRLSTSKCIMVASESPSHASPQTISFSPSDCAVFLASYAAIFAPYGVSAHPMEKESFVRGSYVCFFIISCS